MAQPNFDPSPRRILLVRFSHLGDVVCALPLYHTLRAAFPAARIAWATQTEFAPLLEGLPGLERVITYDRTGGLSAARRLRRDLRAFAPDLAVDAQGNFKSSIAALLSGAPIRVGLHPRDWREPAARHLATDHAAPAAGPHALERASALAQHLTSTTPPRQDPALTAQELRAAEAQLSRHLPGDHPFLLVHLSKPDDPRSWPETRYRELALLVAQEGIGTLFLSGPDEAELHHRLVSHTPAVRHWIDQRGLRELAALFSVAARRGAHLLASDSGPMHLAASCDLRVTLLAGPQDPRATGPQAWGPQHSVLRASLQPACAPCKLRTCHHPRGPVCMSDISAEQAIQAIAPHLRGALTCG